MGVCKPQSQVRSIHPYRISLSEFDSIIVLRKQKYPPQTTQSEPGSFDRVNYQNIFVHPENSSRHYLIAFIFVAPRPDKPCRCPKRWVVEHSKASLLPLCPAHHWRFYAFTQGNPPLFWSFTGKPIHTNRPTIDRYCTHLVCLQILSIHG